MRPLVCLILAILLFAGQANGADLIRERELAQQIREALSLGTPVSLNSAGVEFLALYTHEVTPYSQGGAIILHGRGAHPNWPEVVRPLRTRLPAFGWKTLSIQLPVAAAAASAGVYDQLVAEGFDRIRMAVEFLKSENIRNIVLIGHGLGALTAVEYLAAEPARDIRALVAVGLESREDGQPAVAGALERIALPLFDLYGSQDLAQVLDGAGARMAGARKGDNSGYRQLMIPGANHFFHGLDGTLVSRVHGWLGKVAPGRKIVGTSPVKNEAPVVEKPE
jgi:pimeloyl-ACP methyl ester carboxylesterase